MLKFVGVALGLLLFVFPSVLLADDPPTCQTDASYVLSDASGTFGCNNGYANNVNINWQILSPNENQRITVTFTFFYTEHSFDVVRIYDGTNESSFGTLASYSGNIPPPTVVSSGPGLFLSFSADSSNHYQGFSATYTSAGDYYPPCWSLFSHQDLQGDSGSFGCDGYANNVHYTWNIMAPTVHQHVKVTIHNLETESYNDVLIAFDGENKTASFEQFHGDLSGELGIYTYQGHGPSIVLQFTTDQSVTGRGFYATYEAYGHFLAPCYDKGEIVNLHPQNQLAAEFGCGHYANEASVGWVLNAPLDTERILLWFLGLITESGEDRVTVYDAGYPKEDAILVDLSGNHTFAGPYRSSGPVLFVKFAADNSIIYDGFAGSALSEGMYVPPCPISDQHHETDVAGTLGCDGYSNNVQVTWLIEVADVKQRIVLNFTKLQTESYDDVITIHNGPLPSYESVTFSGHYDHADLPSFQSYGPAVLVVFSSDFSNTDRGFELDYAAYGEFAPPCWTESIARTLTSPSQDGCDGYINNVEATWNLNAPAGATITLTFSEFDTESCCDHLRIYDGPDANAELLYDLSGFYRSIAPILSTGNQLYLRFTSDYSDVDPGFVFAWDYEGGEDTDSTGF